ncbi:hypothetical protein NQ318_021315 [Aromia moschata]|uniref:Lipase domain-containing protein n=1 Tax=Aromia moschata TaxID=1265417 RepID=A0AAV8ZDV3_9CUCU|nr:hypothetical protein NQ318_021315 [Aromia moschata]
MFFFTSTGPPSLILQNNTFQLYPINKMLCSKFDPYRDTIFELYTRDTPDTAQLLRLDDDDSIRNSNINFNNPTVIFFHGFLESSQSDDAQQIKKHYLERSNFNIILVNNERLLAGPYYVTAANNVGPIGQYSAAFVDFLVQKGLHLSRLHIIGMSLGGQIAGITGKNIISGKASRITGLDPAGPLFFSLPSSRRLSKGDAEFVDVIHTNAGGFGINSESGDVDIWMNGGSRQPGCAATDTLTRVPASVSELVFCNHYQAYRTYVMSLIDPTSYLARKCSSYKEYRSGGCDLEKTTYVGLDVDRTATGNYYVDTGVTATDI